MELQSFEVQVKKQYTNGQWINGIIPVKAITDDMAVNEVDNAINGLDGTYLQTIDSRIVWDFPAPDDEEYVDFSFDVTGEVDKWSEEELPTDFLDTSHTLVGELV